MIPLLPRFTRTFALGLWVLTSTLGGQALAQPQGAGAAKSKARPKRAPRVIQLEALKVSGQVQKPEAFYILQRSELDFKGLEPKKSFVPLILKSVEKDPF